MKACKGESEVLDAGCWMMCCLECVCNDYLARKRRVFIFARVDWHTAQALCTALFQP